MSRPVPLRHPLLCPSAYSLDCYCKYENDAHGFREFPHGFVGRNEADCKRQAKARGWKLHNDQTATCPKCVKALG